ncbi:MAG: insulinase family protein [Candidatus Andersenbacteria bacterium]|nr:insulinase family protein [Candidatus Andersenbacteria bacterium]MBI3250996.1 insulinase family protein [Candidatus Andersenbacteria bacterium]
MSFPLIRKTLPSGLRLLLLPREEMQSVTVLTLVGVGSRYESPRQNGLSHFLEHMFFKGTENRPTTKEIAEAIDNVGGEFNAFTGEEYTGYYVKVAARHLSVAADVVSDILLRPLFPAEEIERERGVIIEEIRMYTDNPMRHVQHVWMEALYGSHPLGRRIDGTEETVSALKRADFLAYTKKHYHTKNAVVVVAGNFDANKTTKMLETLFKSLPLGAQAKPKPWTKRTAVHRFKHSYRKTLDQAHIILGVPGVPRGDEREYAAALLATVLGGGMSSRLFLQIRERHGLAYMVRTSSDGYLGTGSFATQAGVRLEKTHDAMRMIQEEYDRIMVEEVPLAELNKAKEIVRGQMVLQLEETNALAMFSSEQELLEGKILTPGEINKKIDAVTPQEVQALAQQILGRKQRAVALLSPHRSTTKFEKLL